MAHRSAWIRARPLRPVAQIYNNTIIGGPQGGILDETLGRGAVYGNTISQGTVGSNQYTNDFAIYAWEQNINVHNNTITPSQGRGNFHRFHVIPGQRDRGAEQYHHRNRIERQLRIRRMPAGRHLRNTI